jgi:PAS domain S-box-containing protein
MRFLGRIAFLCLIFVAAFCHDALARPSKIVVVGDSTYTPFEFTNGQGTPTGITVDIWRLWSKKTGIAVDYRCMTWSDALDAVKTGKADAVGGLFYSEERAKIFDFSPAYYKISTHIFFHKNIYGIKDLNDVPGFRIGVVHEDTSEEFIRKHYPNLEVISFPSNEAMINSAANGKIKMFICDTPIAMFFLTKFGKTEDFRHTVKPLYTSKMYAGVRRGNSELLSTITKGFNDISTEEINGIVSQWTGFSIVNRLPWGKILLSGIMLVFIITLILLWNMSLRRRVAAATVDLELSEHNARKSEERFRAVVEASKDAIVAINSSGKITLFNPAAETMFGYPQEEVIDKDVEHLMPESSHKQFRITLEHILAKDKTLPGIPVIGEMIALKRDGSVFTIEYSVSRGSIGTEPFVFSIIRDITERKRLEAQLLQSQKQEVVGRLAGGIAHDLNNLLSPILGYTELMLIQTGPDEPNHQKLTQIRKAAESAKSLTQQLLAFGRRQVLEMKTINLNTVIRGFEKILKHTIHEDILIQMDLFPDLWNIKADISQIQQILMNMSVNAQDAMPQGGTLCIETKNALLTETDVHTYPEVQPGSYVILTISDTGTGMDNKTMANIFEPFFTTKETGKGTGLGLSTVDGIIKQHKGAITASSEQGKGSVFTIILPCSLEDIDRSFKADHARHFPRGSEAILVVEDNKILLDMACMILKDYGYEVYCAGNAHDSIDIAKINSKHIKLLLTDVIMPDMNGKQLFERLRSYLPDLKVVYMSGYPKDVIAHHGVLDEGISFIQKPFSVETLMDKVTMALHPDNLQD